MKRRLAACLLGLACLLAGAAGDDGVQLLHHARMHGAVDEDVTLPLHWDVLHEGRSGRAELTLDVDLPAAAGADSQRPYAVFIARLGNAYEIAWNGVLLLQTGSMDDAHDRFSAKHPVHLLLPASLLREHNRLDIRLRADAGYRAGLSSVWVGPAAALAPMAERAEWLRVDLPQASAVFSLLVAAFCLLLWWQQRDPLYFWAGCGEALWALSVADTVIEHAPLPWPYWGLVLLLMRAAWAWSLYAIAREVFAPRPRAEQRWVLVVQVASPLCVLAMVALHSTRPLLAWYGINFATWAAVILRLGALARRAPTSERWIVVVALVAVMAASLRDVVAARVEAALYDESAWAKYLATLVGVALMWIVSRRFLQARSEALRLNASLAEQVRQKEAELRETFGRLSAAEQSRAVLAERARILRDMHDGVGSSLATAVRQIESGQARPEQLLQTLRDSMDHLKLSIDSMGLPPGDVNALLASLRYRLQPRIESAGLQVDWQVEPLPPWAGGTEEAMRHLQFIVLEVISNVLQHARARTLALGARVVDGRTVITLADDGRGIAADAAARLGSMQRRARAIAASVRVEAAQPGTCVSITL